tara:strand:- start:488 stop:736 length:249 start_codon:yes stop_codon:yes gene_type:complete
MKTVTIDRETLEFLTRMAIDYSDYLEIKQAEDRKTVRYIDSAITALDLQPELDAEAGKIRAIANARYKAEKEAKAAEEAAAK